MLNLLYACVTKRDGRYNKKTRDYDVIYTAGILPRAYALSYMMKFAFDCIYTQGSLVNRWAFRHFASLKYII